MLIYIHIHLFRKVTKSHIISLERNKEYIVRVVVFVRKGLQAAHI